MYFFFGAQYGLVNLVFYRTHFSRADIIFFKYWFIKTNLWKTDKIIMMTCFVRKRNTYNNAYLKGQLKLLLFKILKFKTTENNKQKYCIHLI